MKNSDMFIHDEKLYVNQSVLTDRLLSFFIYSSVVLPTGSLFGINVKILSLLVFIVGLLIKRKSVVITSTIIKITPLTLFLLIWIALSITVMNYDIEYLPSQAKDVFVFFLMFYICSGYAQKCCGYEYLMKKITTAIFLVGIMKVMILIFSFVTGMPVSVIIRQIGALFGTAIMTFDVESSSISRINFTSDSIIFICLFYMFMKLFREGYTKKDYMVLAVICFSALVSMSRFQWATCVLSVMIALFLNLKKKKAFIVICMITVSSIGTLSLPSVQEMIKTRFDQRVVDASDSERDFQKIAIYAKIDASPIIGNGVGYYIPTMIRSYIAKYSYELQIQALVMQFGWLGTTFIMLMILVPLASTRKGMSVATFLMYMAICFVWLSGALFNPILFSSSAGAGMAALYAIGNASWIKMKKQR